MKSKVEEISAYALGSPPPGLRPCASVQELPAEAQLVVVDAEALDAVATLSALRRRSASCRCIAALPLEGAGRIATLLAAGFDAVAVGPEQLAAAVTREREHLALASAYARQTRMHDGIVQVIDQIARRPELQEVLNVAVLRISELFGIERVSVVIFDQRGQVGFVVMEREQALLDNIVISISDYPELQQIIATKEPLIIPDVFGDALLEGVRGKLTAAQQPHRAAVLLPLLRKDHVVGALFLRSTQRMEQVDEQLLATGRLIASVTAVAIGHALEHDMLVSEKRALMRSKAWMDEQLAGLKELREFLDHAKDGMLVTDAAGVIRYANGAAAAILHQAHASLVGKTLHDLLLPHCHGLAARALRGDAVGDEYGYVDLTAAGADPADDKGVVISAAVRPLSHPEGVFISFRDVTQLREIESELRQTKEFLENLIQSSVDAIIASDTDGRVILFNRAAEQMLGYSARETVGRTSMSALYPDGEAEDVMRKLRSEAYGGRGRLQLLRKDLLAHNGELVPVNLTAAIIYEGEREVATVTICSDLRERRRIEEKLSQVQRKLQLTERQAVAMELAGVAAHELNQPLTSILGYAEMLKKRVPEGDPGRKAVDVIARETERMASIVRKIGQITAYQTKPSVGSSQILDISAGGGREGREASRDGRGDDEAAGGGPPEREKR